jgi:hypothetical protein
MPDKSGVFDAMPRPHLCAVHGAGRRSAAENRPLGCAVIGLYRLGPMYHPLRDRQREVPRFLRLLMIAAGLVSCLVFIRRLGSVRCNLDIVRAEAHRPQLGFDVDVIAAPAPAPAGSGSAPAGTEAVAALTSTALAVSSSHVRVLLPLSGALAAFSAVWPAASSAGGTTGSSSTAASAATDSPTSAAGRAAHPVRITAIGVNGQFRRTGVAAVGFTAAPAASAPTAAAEPF